MGSTEFAISPRREEDYPEWYQQVIKFGELAENAPVRGCMIIKPWGYGIWESMQRQMDARIKALGHENVYFPLFIPLSFLTQEASHVEGFAKECAVVTHSRLEMKEGKLVPTSPLEEPLIVRPTSETIFGHAMAKWVKSYRDLPLLLNQWANVVRWEMRTRLFLRTTEFLWQEGHTVHATEAEAQEEAMTMLKMYQEFTETLLAMPVILGKKTPHEKFPGAETTYTFEAMMQDKKAIQGGTSHYLGQNFSKAFDIRFLNKDSQQEFAYTTSWGSTTRLIGGLVMTHGDDNGLRLPPRISPKHMVIIPFLTKEEDKSSVLQYCEALKSDLQKIKYHGEPLQIIIDKKDIRGGEKNWHWIKKGIPIRIEVGPRDIQAGKLCFARRDKSHKEKITLEREDFLNQIVDILDQIQNQYYADAKQLLDNNIHRNIQNYAEFEKFFTPKNKEKPEIHGGFVLGKWCESNACEQKIAELKVSIRCLPLEQSNTKGNCIICGKEASVDAIYAKSY